MSVVVNNIPDANTSGLYSVFTQSKWKDAPFQSRTFIAICASATENFHASVHSTENAHSSLARQLSVCSA